MTHKDHSALNRAYNNHLTVLERDKCPYKTGQMSISKGQSPKPLFPCLIYQEDNLR